MDGFLGWFGLSKSGALGGLGGALIVFIRRRTLDAAFMAAGGVILTLIATRPFMSMLALGKDLEIAAAAFMSVFGMALVNRALHLIEQVEWSHITGWFIKK